MDFLYRFSESIGFDHPLHPPLTHMPAGLVVAAFTFLLIALAFKRHKSLNTTAYHCSVLALIFLFPTALLGFTDWWHFYAGVWSFPIKIKIYLTIALFIFLVIGIIMEMKNIGGLMSKSIVYFLCVVSVIGLGYFGGQLVFADRLADSSDGINDGEKLYAVNCGSCHPNGGNLINPSLPVINSPTLKSLDTFINYSRNPRRPNGPPGTMPVVSKEKLSDQQLRKIYQYIINSLAKKPS
jgi:uncharacterized membrane protein